jgi:hypothetical protein
MRFVPRAAIADAARRAPQVDAGPFRRDIDAVVDPSVDGCSHSRPSRHVHPADLEALASVVRAVAVD